LQDVLTKMVMAS